jgi:hypothetical protein
MPHNQFTSTAIGFTQQAYQRRGELMIEDWPLPMELPFCTSQEGSERTRIAQLVGFRCKRESHTELFVRAMLRLLIRTPAQKFRAVTKPTTSEVVVLDLNNQLWFQWLPFS